jgi:RNA polymerase sigma factor (sigma-70 family)
MAVVISDRLLESSDRLMDAEPDEHLVSLVQTGHETAFAAIVRRYERELQAQARRLTSDGRGEDAVQQAFLNAFTALQGRGEVRHLRGWLHQILRNEITRARAPFDAPLDAAVAYGEPLEDTVQRRATFHETLVELSALPERQRDALLGTAVLGFPRAHVARTMGLSEGAVRQLVHRARARLRQAATAFIPFPLLKLFGAARSGVEAAPDAAIGAGTAASGGLVIKFGALLASGVVATGIAVTHPFPSAHHRATPAGRGHHRATHSRAARASSPAAPVTRAASDPATVTSSMRLAEHRAAAMRQDLRSHEGPGRLSGTRSGRGGGPGHGRGSPAGRGDDGSLGSGSGRPGGGHDGASGSGSGSDGPSRSGNGGGGTATGSGRPSGSDSGTRSGSGSDGGSGSSDGGDGSGSGSFGATSGSGSSGATSGSGSSGATSGSGSSGSSGTSGTPTADTGDATSSDGGGGDGTSGGGSGNGDDANAVSSDGDRVTAQASGSGSDGRTENSGGSRDVSGSLDSSSS